MSHLVNSVLIRLVFLVGIVFTGVNALSQENQLFYFMIAPLEALSNSSIAPVENSQLETFYFDREKRIFLPSQQWAAGKYPFCIFPEREECTINISGETRERMVNKNRLRILGIFSELGEYVIGEKIRGIRAKDLKLYNWERAPFSAIKTTATWKFDKEKEQLHVTVNVSEEGSVSQVIQISYVKQEQGQWGSMVPHYIFSPKGDPSLFKVGEEKIYQGEVLKNIKVGAELNFRFFANSTLGLSHSQGGSGSGVFYIKPNQVLTSFHWLKDLPICSEVGDFCDLNVQLTQQNGNQSHAQLKARILFVSPRKDYVLLDIPVPEEWQITIPEIEYDNISAWVTGMGYSMDNDLVISIGTLHNYQYFSLDADSEKGVSTIGTGIYSTQGMIGGPVFGLKFHNEQNKIDKLAGINVQEIYNEVWRGRTENWYPASFLPIDVISHELKESGFGHETEIEESQIENQEESAKESQGSKSEESKKTLWQKFLSIF